MDGPGSLASCGRGITGEKSAGGEVTTGGEATEGVYEEFGDTTKGGGGGGGPQAFFLGLGGSLGCG